MSVKVSVTSGNLQALAEQAAQRASEIVMKELFAAFQASFDANAWDWPRSLPTRKLTGTTLAERLRSYNQGKGITPPNPRNIVDTGNLRGTGSWQMTGPYQATFTWSAQYATAVHEGASIYPWGSLRRARNRGLSSRQTVGPIAPPRRVQLPARPWTRAVLGQENVSGIRVYNIGQRLRDVWLDKLRRP